MFVLKVKTILNNVEFDFITECEVRWDLEELTSSAVVRIPKKLVYKRNGQTVNNIVEGSDPVFKRGQKAELYAGYDDQLNLVFRGYISDILPQLPLEFTIQDEMYLMKQVTITNYAKKNLTLKQLLTDILPGTVKFQSLDVQLGWFRIKRSNVAKVLEHLKSHYGLTCTFREGVLYAGLRYTTEDPFKVEINEFTFGKNIIDDSALVYKREDDQFIKLKAISIDNKNEKIDVEVGDSFGDQRTMYFYGLSKADLTKIANESIKKLKYEGFFGRFQTFLIPQVKPGTAVRIINPGLPEKNGVYLVKAVVTRYGQNGGTQDIELERKIA